MQAGAQRAGGWFGDRGTGGHARADGDERLAWRAGALLQAQRDACGRERFGAEMCGGVETFETELAEQGLDRDATAFTHRVRTRRGRARPLAVGGAERGLRVVAGFLGEELLGAGVERAESAGAAERGPVVPLLLAGAVEAESAHHEVRFDGVAEQEARAVFRAVATLVAGGFADARLGCGRRELALHDRVFAREHDDAGGRFRDGHVEICRRLAHHHAAEAEHGIGHGGAAGGSDALGETRADGHGERDRLSHGAGDREVFDRDRAAVRGGGDVGERLDVVHDDAGVNREARGRNEAAGDFVDEIVFVAGGVVVAEQLHHDARAGAGDGDGFDGVLVLRLDRDDTRGGADGVHREFDAAHDVARAVLHDGGVLVEQRLAFGAVGDDGAGARG